MGELQCFPLGKLENINRALPFEKQKDPNVRWDLFASH
jgi:hypothetical protein